MTRIFILWPQSSKEIQKLTDRIRLPLALARKMLRRRDQAAQAGRPLLVRETRGRQPRVAGDRRPGERRPGERRVSRNNYDKQVSDDDLTSSDSAPASQDSGEDGEVKMRPVSVANTTQCCGGLKSGVCTII